MPEQLSNTELLLKELEKMPEHKKERVVTSILAYINGIEAGLAYAQEYGFISIHADGDCGRKKSAGRKPHKQGSPPETPGQFCLEDFTA